MTPENEHYISALRQRAQSFLAAQESDIQAFKAEDVRKLVHELDTYQIELELQNQDLRQAQIELEQSHKKYIDLFDFAPVGYCTVSSKGLILAANLTCAKMLGLARGALIRQPLSNFVVAEDQDTFYQIRRNLLETGKRQSCRLRFKNVDDATIPVLLELTFTPEQDTDPGSFVITISDISEIRKFEEKLVFSKNEWEATFSALPEMITIHDKSRRVLRANKAAHAFMDFNTANLDAGKHCYESLCGLRQPCVDCPMVLSVQDGQVHSKIMMADALGKTLEITTAPIKGLNNDVDCFVHIARDISAQVELEKQLRQKYKMEAIGVLAGGMAHNFNNNLSIILGNVEMALLKLARNHEVTALLNKAKTGIFRSRELVQQILSYSRMGHTIREPISVRRAIDETIELLSATLPTSIRIEKLFSPDSAELWVNANLSQMQEGLINLCANAMHAMQEEGVLTVGLDRVELKEQDLEGQNEKKSGSFARVLIRDTGCGMTDEIMEKIFDPFFTTKELTDGTGMGLPLLKASIEEEGGFVVVTSAPGCGSTFTFYLPIVDAPVQEEQAITGDMPLSPGSERILLVDDEEMLVDAWSSILSEYGYQVTVETNSKNALKRFKENPEQFDLVIADQTMPDLLGNDLLKEILCIRPGLPTILCSGYNSKVNEADALALGVRAYCLKPIDLAGLVSLTRRILDEKSGKL